MKTSNRNPFLLPTVIVGLGLTPFQPVEAQTFRAVCDLDTGGTGGSPNGDLVLSGNTLYGTTYVGGSWDNGTIYAVNIDGTGFRILHEFTGTFGNSGPSGTNSDGANPRAGVILSETTLYGTAYAGGIAGYGTVFAINTDGTGYTVLHSFTNGNDGILPTGGLILSGNTLYGMANQNGLAGAGTVFGVNTDGTGFHIVHSFGFSVSEGATPVAQLIISGNTLWGTTVYGGSANLGTVFTVNTDSTGFQILHSFTGGNDGSHPFRGVVLSGNTLYGTAQYGGSGYGTVFAVNTDATGFTTLHSFTNGTDGANPRAELVLSGNTLYGAALYGGSPPYGTVFAVNTDGTGFTTLYNFTAGSDGAFPAEDGLLLSGNTFYGTDDGGTDGIVYSLSFAPQLTITFSGASVILSWPTELDGFDYSGFTLQSTTDLLQPAWNTVSTAPTIVNGQYTVADSISGLQQFYRLSR